MYSKFLESKKDLMKKLIESFKDYDYVSILGNDIFGKTYQVTNKNKNISENSYERGFVIKLYKDKLYREYSFDNLSEDNFNNILEDIKNLNEISYDYIPADTKKLSDEPLVKDFRREKEEKVYTDEEILKTLEEAKDLMKGSKNIVNAMASFSTYEVSKCFISRNRELTQNYSYYNLRTVAVSKDLNNMKQARGGADGIYPSEVLKDIKEIALKTSDLARRLLKAKAVKPGVYDVITDSSITGLIAHEAFGHGVEMDMFVKNRALAKDYLGKYVASPIVNMHDGASAATSVASYFFDDEGVLAHDTLIIDKGILLTGISDPLSASVLGTKPTGNGRRESYSHKTYTRMTNTFFAPGKDKLSDMIKSVDYGYMLFDTNNGMEDPKNWGIQCTAEYGLEIKDGKFTGEIIAPVIMSGYVPDLLKSITMISDDFKLEGSGFCGKGYKEWVRVSDGGPCLKARVKLG